MIQLIKYFYRQSGTLLWLGIVSGAISGVAAAALVAVIAKGLNGPGKLSVAGMFLGLCLAYLVFKSCSELSLLHLTQAAILSLRVRLSNKLLTTPLRKLQELQKHGLLLILTKDIDSLITAFQLIPLAFSNTILTLASLCYLASLSWPLFVIFALTLTTCGFAYHLGENRLRQQLLRVREQLDVLYGHFCDLIEGSKELQLNAQRGRLFVERVIAPSAQHFRHSYVRGMTGYIWVSNSGTMLFYLVIGGLLFILRFWLPQSGALVTTVTVVLIYLVRPVSEIMSILPILRQATIALSKAQQLDKMLTFTEHRMQDGEPFAARTPLSLELHGVCHRYHRTTDASQFALGPIDLLLYGGEMLFIIGGNGSGKTTLAMLILGLHEPDAGKITLNGTLVTQANLDQYREHFAAVFSDFHLFEHIIGNNQEDLNARAMNYIREFDMAHKVRVVDGKFSTIELSRGQRKRLALVSSYLEDRPIYLFDEWAADQDPGFKRLFYTELLPDLKERGKTVVVISHDEAYFGCADRIVKLIEGRLESIDLPSKTQ
jgi:putative ATP-binding cassette transporter